MTAGVVALGGEGGHHASVARPTESPDRRRRPSRSARELVRELTGRSRRRHSASSAWASRCPAWCAAGRRRQAGPPSAVDGRADRRDARRRHRLPRGSVGNDARLGALVRAHLRLRVAGSTISSTSTAGRAVSAAASSPAARCWAGLSGYAGEFGHPRPAVGRRRRPRVAGAAFGSARQRSGAARRPGDELDELVLRVGRSRGARRGAPPARGARARAGRRR